MRILITGGAGFIGTKLTRALQTSKNNQICILDNLHPQIHGLKADFPVFESNVSCQLGDIRDVNLLKNTITQFKPTHVVHLAAETGTGQSMDEIQRYCSVNVDGTAILTEQLIPHSSYLQKVILASSRAVYGEGLWKDLNNASVVPQSREAEDMDKKLFEPKYNGTYLKTPIKTNESASVSPSSIYASTKLMQEYIFSQSPLKPKTLIFRFQNVYGAGQSLKNPYTGVLSIFTSQLFQNNKLNIFEDGLITRDFVNVKDIVDGIIKGLSSDVSNSEIINLGAGEPTTILDAAQTLCGILGFNPETQTFISGNYRTGDIRHAVADIRKAKKLLDWTPRVTLREGLEELVTWSRDTLKK